MVKRFSRICGVLFNICGYLAKNGYNAVLEAKPAALIGTLFAHPFRAKGEKT
jgi:hypothetical protein